MTWAKLLSGLVSLINLFAGMFKDNQIRQDGANESVLKGIEEDAKLSTDIATARANAELRKSTREKYTKR